MFRKSWVLFTIFLICCFLLNGCSNKPKTLKVALDLNDEEWVVFREKIFPAFENEYGISIDAIQVDDQDLHHILKADKDVKQVKIDIFSINSQQMQLFVDDKLVDDLSSYAQFLSKRINLQILSDLYFGDRLYFIPFKINVYGYYLDDRQNRKIFDYPITFSYFKKSFKDAVKRGEKINFIFPTSKSEDLAIWLYEIILNYGGNPYKFSFRNLNKTFYFLNEIKHYFSKDSFKANLENGSTFIKKDHINLIYGKYDLKNPHFIKQYYLLRTIKSIGKEKHVVDGLVIGIFKDSKNKDNATKFINFLLSKKVQSILFYDLKWIPLRVDVVNKDDTVTRKQIRIINNMLMNSVYIKDKAKWETFIKDINKIFSEVVLKDKPLTKVLMQINQNP